MLIEKKKLNLSIGSLTQSNSIDLKEKLTRSKVIKTNKQFKSIQNVEMNSCENSLSNSNCGKSKKFLKNKETKEKIKNDSSEDCSFKIRAEQSSLRNNSQGFNLHDNYHDDFLFNNLKINKSKNNNSIKYDIIEDKSQNLSNPCLHNAPMIFNMDSNKEKKEFKQQININIESQESQYNKFINLEFNLKTVPNSDGGNQKTKSKFEKNLEFYSNYNKNNNIANSDEVIDKIKYEIYQIDKINLSTNPSIFLEVFCCNNFNIISDLKKSFLGIDHSYPKAERGKTLVNNYSLNNKMQNNFNNNNSNYYLNHDFFFNNTNNDLYFDYHNKLFLKNISIMNSENLFFKKLFKKGN